MSQAIIKRFLVRPIAPLSNFAEVWMALCQTGVEHCNFHTGSWRVTKEHLVRCSVRGSEMDQVFIIPVNPKFHKASACRTEVICRGTALKSRRPLYRPVECQKVFPYENTESETVLTFNQI